MTICITWTTGRRPLTASLSARSLFLQGLPVPPTVVFWDIGQWDDPEDALDALGMEEEVPYTVSEGTNRGASHNAGLAAWMGRNGDLPDYWFAVDDDVVPSRRMWDRMIAVVDADPEVYLLGCWNDGCERDELGPWRGHERIVAGEVVQYGDDFNVGGAVQLFPRRALLEIGTYDPEMTWLEDHDYTSRVRRAGKQAAIARSIFAVVLEDDGVDPGYRSEMYGRFLASRKEKLGW